MPAYAPAIGFTLKARAVPIPWAATPTAKPRACQSVIDRMFINGVTMIAPMIPVKITRTAVSVGMPPTASEMPSATGAVVDLGARDSNTLIDRSKNCANTMAEPAATVEPATRAHRMGITDFFIVARLSQRGSEPPHLNWSSAMFRKRRTDNDEQTTEAGRDYHEVEAS